MKNCSYETGFVLVRCKEGNNGHRCDAVEISEGADYECVAEVYTLLMSRSSLLVRTPLCG